MGAGSLTRREFIAAAAAAAGTASVPKISKPAGTAFIYDPKYLEHDMGSGHPESPERLRAVMGRMQAIGLLEDVVQMKPSVDPDGAIKLNHSREHERLIKGGGHDDGICRLSVSGALTAVDAVFAGRTKNAFCALRPPGHHAENGGEYGFCFYNNVAVAARYAMKKHKAERVAIVDWDYHHGNGTQWSFYDDPSVLFFSTHDRNAFPGRTGSVGLKGKGDGVGFNINAPLPAGAGDKEILGAFEKQFLPEADKLKPDLVLISAGFDSRKEDVLGRFKVTDDGFKKLTELVMAIAKEHAQSRVVSLLEGGYNVEGLASAVEAHVGALLA